MAGSIRLALALALAALVLAARFLLLTKEHAIWIQSYVGYYLVLAALAWFVVSCIREYRLANVHLSDLIARHAAGVGVILACSALLHLHEPHEFRVLHDEPSHVAGSLMMHEERMAVMPGTAHRLFGDIQFQRNFPSFRGYLFQVILATIHDLTGYRPANVFWLNGALTLVLLALLYRAGTLFGGSRCGIFSVLLFSTLPLLAQNVTSGGYDVLNLVLILALLLTTERYLRVQSTAALDLMVSTAVLLALTRYESIVYLFVPIGAAAWTWAKTRRITLSSTAAAAPILVLPCFVSNLIMVSTDEFTMAHLRPETVKFFDSTYITPHLQQAIYYFFNFDNDSSNSLLLSLIGMLGLVGFWVSLGSRLLTRKRPVSAAEGSFLGVSVISVGLMALSLSHFWGSPTESAATRFTLPLQLIFAIAGAWLALEVWRKRGVPRSALFAVAAYLFLFTIPTNAKHTVTDMMVVGKSNQWFVEYAQSHDRGRTLYVSQSALSMIMHRYPAIATSLLNERAEKALQCLESGVYDEILIHQIFWIDKSGARLTHPSAILDPKIATELVAQQKFRPDQVSEILRFVGLKKEDGAIRTPATRTQQPVFDSDAEQMRYYLEMLP